MAYRITIELKNVAEGDATGLAQQIYDEHGDELDADRGEFVVSVSTLTPAGQAFATDWAPER